MAAVRLDALAVEREVVGADPHAARSRERRGTARPRPRSRSGTSPASSAAGRDPLHHLRPAAAEQAHDVHALGVAEAGVELDHLHAVGGREEAAVHDAAEVAAFGAEALDHALDDRARLRVVGGCHERQRRPGQRERAHAARSRALVAVVAVGVVVGGRREHDRAAVADRLDRELGADDLLLDQHRLPGPPASEQLQRVRARLLVVCEVRSHHLHALAAGETRGLDDDRRRAEGRDRLVELARIAGDAQPRRGLGRDLGQQRRARTPCSTRSRRPRASARPRAIPCAQQRVDDARRRAVRRR